MSAQCLSSSQALRLLSSQYHTIVIPPNILVSAALSDFMRGVNAQLETFDALRTARHSLYFTPVNLVSP